MVLHSITHSIFVAVVVLHFTSLLYFQYFECYIFKTAQATQKAYFCFSQYIPLKAWLYRDGFARFSNTRFSLSSIDDQCILCIHSKIPPPPPPNFISRPIVQEFTCLFPLTLKYTDIHLTNVAVQKTAPDYDPEKVCQK